jgi:hypothetical protein
VATFTLTRPDLFPNGTSVGAYPKTNWTFSQLPPAGAAPGSATATATVSSGSAAFTGLADNTEYFAGASVSGTWRYITIVTGPPAASAGTESDPIAEADLATHEADSAAHSTLFDAKLAKASNLSDLASASTARTNLGLGTAATQASSAFTTPLTIVGPKTANYTALANEFVLIDTTTSAVTVTFPTSPATGTRNGAKVVTLGTGNAATVALGGSDVFNKTGGGTTASLSLSSQALLAQYAGSNIWPVTSTDVPLSQTDLRYILLSTGTAKGALLAYTASGAIAQLAVGTDGQGLVADSTQTTGLAWKGRSRVLGSTAGLTTIISASTTETTVVSIALPTTLAAGDVVHLKARGDLLNNSGSGLNITFKLKLGTTTILTSGSTAVSTSANRRQWRLESDLLVVTPASSALLDGVLRITPASATTWSIANSSYIEGYAYATSSVDLTAGPNYVLTATFDNATSTDLRLAFASLEVGKA